MNGISISLILVAVAACDDTALGPGDGSLDLSADPPIRTSAETYVLERDAIGWSVVIPITYINESRGPYYLVNCGGSYSFWLERWMGDRWVYAWSPTLPACLSPVIRIESGATFPDTLWIFAGFPRTKNHPQFVFDDPGGRHRFVIEALSSYDEEVYPFGPLIPLERRVSNAFQLVAE